MSIERLMMTTSTRPGNPLWLMCMYCCVDRVLVLELYDLLVAHCPHLHIHRHTKPASLQVLRKTLISTFNLPHENADESQLLFWKRAGVLNIRTRRAMLITVASAVQALQQLELPRLARDLSHAASDPKCHLVPEDNGYTPLTGGSASGAAAAGADGVTSDDESPPVRKPARTKRQRYDDEDFVPTTKPKRTRVDVEDVVDVDSSASVLDDNHDSHSGNSGNSAATQSQPLAAARRGDVSASSSSESLPLALLPESPYPALKAAWDRAGLIVRSKYRVTGSAIQQQ